ncbi:MAG: hypothetical protein H6603_05415 [Flavobacteriales bacterium]|nr:hypothetical protein [Flavobacteriales bacterium]MCB9191584.1 hypothetical protein [Flavobacteriales bacterium]MCB9204399.1 hypothetical protein [Flavobacteriales bacterium]
MNFKLEKLFIEEKYEDVAYKGISMVESDKYKNDPEIYLYVAMAWYEISQMNDEAMEEEYPKALQDAFKYAAKFAKKDKEGVWAEDNSDFFEDLKKAGIADAAQWIDDDKKRRNAVSSYKYMSKAMPDDPNLLFFKGVLEYMNRNSGQADRDVSMAMADLITKYADPKYKPSRASAPVLEDGLLRWTDIMLEQSYADSAKKTINWALKFFPESEKVATKAESLK